MIILHFIQRVPTFNKDASEHNETNIKSLHQLHSLGLPFLEIIRVSLS